MPEPDDFSHIEKHHRRIWLRVQKAFERGKGVRLTPQDVAVLAQTDFAEDLCISDN
jgi:hypothetical protein